MLSLAGEIAKTRGLMNSATAMFWQKNSPSAELVVGKKSYGGFDKLEERLEVVLILPERGRSGRKSEIVRLIDSRTHVNKRRQRHASALATCTDLENDTG